MRLPQATIAGAYGAIMTRVARRMWGQVPDNAVVLAYSTSSCGVPDHFMPCPTLTAPDDLVADVETVPHGTNDLDAVVVTACACACGD
jgi:hypothetical protein